MSQASALASIFIKQFEAQKRSQLVSLRAHEFNLLRKLIPITPDRVIKDRKGNITLYQFRRDIVVNALKHTFQFKTVPEATKEIQEVAKDFRK